VIFKIIHPCYALLLRMGLFHRITRFKVHSSQLMILFKGSYPNLPLGGVRRPKLAYKPLHRLLRSEVVLNQATACAQTESLTYRQSRPAPAHKRQPATSVRSGPFKNCREPATTRAYCYRRDDGDPYSPEN
jgi:hypothetical protein